MKKTICLLLALVFLAFSLSSCSKPVNFIGVEPLCLAELDGEMYFLSYYISKNYKIDFDNKTMSLVENEELAMKALDVLKEAGDSNIYYCQMPSDCCYTGTGDTDKYHPDQAGAQRMADTLAAFIETNVLK